MVDDNEASLATRGAVGLVFKTWGYQPRFDPLVGPYAGSRYLCSDENNAQRYRITMNGKTGSPLA